jgi:Ca2+/H+ antiporter, TMEM165/GDT1 family
MDSLATGAAPLVVVIGTTLDMLIADIPAVIVGNKFAAKIAIKLVHSIAEESLL